VFNKRYQVLLSDWMEDYIKFVAERYDLNASSVIRLNLCSGILRNISILCPEYKMDLDDKEFVELIKKASKNELMEEEGHRMMSKILFEARKAVEYRLSKEKKQKKL
jgi:hypothetical protein